jgi:hypothetical protein
MKRWGKFSTLKERGEWVELQFMAAAASRGYHISRPWGDSRPYDVGVEHGADFIRVQVKSTTDRRGAGYSCGFTPGRHSQDYTLDLVDLFAAYVIPENAWYLIPAALLLGEKRKPTLMLCPVSAGRDGCKHERYREAWALLGKDRRELGRTRQLH